MDDHGCKLFRSASPNCPAVRIDTSANNHANYVCETFFTILCLTPRTTVTLARIPDKDTCHRAQNLCVFSRVQKGTLGLTHKGCVLQRVPLGALSDVTVVLGMRQSIERNLLMKSATHQSVIASILWCLCSN